MLDFLETGNTLILRFLYFLCSPFLPIDIPVLYNLELQSHFHRADPFLLLDSVSHLSIAGQRFQGKAPFRQISTGKRQPQFLNGPQGGHLVKDCTGTSVHVQNGCFESKVKGNIKLMEVHVIISETSSMNSKYDVDKLVASLH